MKGLGIPGILIALLLLASLVAIISFDGSDKSVANGESVLLYYYPGLVVAMAGGLFGATFSMLTQTQNRTSVGNLDDVAAAGSWHTLIMRCSVGVGAAAILYFFFESDLLEGSLWPKLNELKFVALDSGQDPILPNKHWCLLVDLVGDCRILRELRADNVGKNSEQERG